MFSKNLLAVGITILFLGLAIQPSIATVQPEKIIVEPNVDDVEGLVAQLKIVINEISEKYESYPKVVGFWDIIDNLLGLIEKIGLKIGVYIFLLLFAICFL